MIAPHATLDANALAATLRYLAGSVDLWDMPVDIDEAAGAVSNEADWMAALAGALPRIGLRASWVDATPQEAARHARPDLPLVTEVSDGWNTGWLVLDRLGTGRVHVWSSSTWLPNGWYRHEELAEALGPAPRTWGRVEATLTASPLEATPSGSSPTARLRRLLHVERGAVGVVVVYAVAVGILSLATPLAIQVLINWLAFGGLYQPVVVLSGALLVCLTLAATLMASQRYAVELIQRRLFVRSVTEVGARLARVRISSLDRVDGPELANRFFDVLTLQKATKTLLIDGLTAALQAAVGLLLLAVYHPYLLVFDLAVIALAAAALVPLLQSGQDSAIKESKAKYAVAAWIEELARHPLVFKFGGLDHAEARLERASLSYVDARASHFKTFFRQYLGMQAVQVLVQVGLLLTCGWLVLDGQLTLGQLVAAEFIVASALAGLTKFTDKLETVYDLLAGVDKLGALMDLPHERPVGHPSTPRPEGTEVVLSGVSYRWTPDAAPVFTDVDLRLPPGSRVAITGAAGSGKSVLGELIVGIRDPSSGTVWRDGVPVVDHLRERIYDRTLLLHASGLIHGTIRENLVLGRQELDDAAIWNALRAVGLADGVAALAHGPETVLTPDGAPLSQSRLRALLVARALLLAPELIVVDGLLDGVPSRSRDTLIGAFDQLPKTTTVLVLTEDPNTANRLHPLYELRDGGLHARPRLTQV